MSLSFSYQPTLFDLETEKTLDHARYNGRSGAFSDNMSLPVHRWYRYSAGFSADWVRCLIQEHREKSRRCVILDPFCGVATTLLACAAENTTGFGFEVHPFINRVANAKLGSLRCELPLLTNLFQSFGNLISTLPAGDTKSIPVLLSKCYREESLSQLLGMRDLFLTKYNMRTPETELLWLLLTSILRSCSGVGTAQWQYILPNKNKSSVLSPLQAFRSKSAEMIEDIEYIQHAGWSENQHLSLTDARDPSFDGAIEADLVVTSPPYPNNYDYADATRLEMTFWGEITGWGDLQGKVRKHLIHSCSQHSAAEKLVLDLLLAESVVEPIRDDLSAACHTLAEIRQTKGGKKTYHTMAAAYFRDLGLVFRALRPLCRIGSIICFVVGDSAPYGVHLPVEKWLGTLAIAAGFQSFKFEKIRNRNIKWKNRKHQVPLNEGRLWIQG